MTYDEYKKTAITLSKGAAKGCELFNVRTRHGVIGHVRVGLIAPLSLWEGRAIVALVQMGEPGRMRQCPADLWKVLLYQYWEEQPDFETLDRRRYEELTHSQRRKS